jgi:hypothetical protein
MDYWTPVISAFDCILNAMPLEQRERAVEALKLMAEVQANHGDRAAEYFCRALAGEEYPVPQQEPSATKPHGEPLQFSRFRAVQGGKPPKDDVA